MKNLIYLSMVVAVISIAIGTACSFQGTHFVGNITPRALLGFASVALLFGVNFGLLALIK